tara:strand:+ start:12509 stop:13477 length:969 start_codon:yes stop_codon:yes gene_type:complete
MKWKMEDGVSYKTATEMETVIESHRQLKQSTTATLPRIVPTGLGYEWESSTPPPEIQLAQLAMVYPKGIPRQYKGFYRGVFKDHIADPKLAELLKGKRVAYVCPSPHLEGKGMGHIIDSYDLVVRVNQGYKLTEEEKKDYGSRTDILFNCCNIRKLLALKDDAEYLKKLGLKFFVCANLSMWDIDRTENFLNEISHTANMPWYNIDDGYLFNLYREVGTICNTGLVGILELLNYDVEELYVTGMTFFNMSQFGRVYTDSYHDGAVEFGTITSNPEREPTETELRMDIHNQPRQIEYFQRILDEHHGSKLFVDEYLMENFDVS